MKTKNILLSLLAIGAGAFVADAAAVKVEMNAVSTTMALHSKTTGEAVEIGSPANKIYNFEAPAGEYVLTAYGTDGVTVNGTIGLTVNDADDSQSFKIITCTLYVTNKTNGTTWTADNGDYTIEAKVNSREGVRQEITVGKSVTAGRNTILAHNGNSYQVAFIPSAAHQAEGYTTLYKNGTLTGNINIQGAVPMGGDFTITLPADAKLEIARKEAHFIDLAALEPTKTEVNGDTQSQTFYLADKQMYFYRTWKDGELTQGGFFTYYTDATKCPEVKFTQNDYKAFNPATINHDVKSNNGYETGDILLNINERGHLRMNVGETFNGHAMRMWELTDNQSSNNFIEPDFHYTVLTPDGKPSTGVIEISQKEGSAWADVKAVGNGTAIVLVTYDGIGLNYFSNATKSPYMGGEFWGAIWPENTGVYVVTVGETASAAEPNMVINEKYNKETLKMAGKFVDAEHDVFYYLDSEEGATYTFKPEGVAEITIAYPTIGEKMATYSGFGNEGVTKNEDGSYSLLLKEGRQIVKLADAQGNAVYQVLTAKKCTREIINASRPGSEIFQPGDEIKIQYAGLRHPANKIAGIYNMSAYVTYNGIPNGSSLILGSGQYTFGSAPSAQAVTVTVPADLDIAANPTISMTEGVIQVNGYGDPIGNHRNIDNIAGRSPNFTAVAHKTYFGALPDIIIPLSEYRDFDIATECNVADAEIMVTFKGTDLTADENGLYKGTYGDYAVVAKKAGYRCFRQTFTVADDAEGTQTFKIEMLTAPDAWDGVSVSEPELLEGCYQITNPAELAWFAAHVNEGNPAVNAVVINDIDLGGYDWTPIGTAAATVFGGAFDGDTHTVNGLYAVKEGTNFLGLFGYVKGTTDAPASVSGVTVYGEVSGKQYLGGIAGYVNQNSTIDRCANYATVKGTSTYVGGVAGYLSNATAKVTNCYNAGAVSGTSNVGGVVGGHNANSVIANVFNVGEVSGTSVGACVGSTSKKTNVTNAFALTEHHVTEAHTLVTEDQMKSGEVAYRLGEAFTQELGVHPHPVFGSYAVKYDPAQDRYYNEGNSGVDEIAIDGEDDVTYYNLQGVASATPWQGLNLVRHADGTVTKQVFK